MQRTVNQACPRRLSNVHWNWSPFLGHISDSGKSPARNLAAVTLLRYWESLSAATAAEPFCLQGVNNITSVTKRDKVFDEMWAALTDSDGWYSQEQIPSEGGRRREWDVCRGWDIGSKERSALCWIMCRETRWNKKNIFPLQRASVTFNHRCGLTGTLSGRNWKKKD